MTKAKNRYNQKGRTNRKVEFEDDGKQSKVEVEGMREEIQLDNDTNMLLLPSKKRKTKIIDSHESNRKQLTKKQRKIYEKVVERKEKSLKRDDLLKKLAEVQVDTNELKLYTSVKDIGKKEKRKFDDFDDDDDMNLSALTSSIINNAADQQQQGSEKPDNRVVNSISGSNKKKYKTKGDEDEERQESSTDTDDYSTDSEIDESEIQAALEAKQKSKALKESLEKIKEKISEKEKEIDSEEEKDRQMAEENAKPLVNRKARYVHVERTEEVKESRAKLPIITEEQVIMEKIFDNPIVIICGETGSGKTTQTPQFLYEAGFAEDGQMIGVTEPRRVAAISMSKRVGYEMNCTEDTVSYQIRYEGNVSPNTKIKFMTDGVLLKEIQMDFMLTKYSVVIIDEAHERSVYTDILIGLLSRIVPLRNKRGSPLKLIIMSATLRVEDFTENTRLFKIKPPVINVQSRQFPVTIHFNKHTYQDYLAEAYKKTCKIHRRLPDGGILIFVTGQQEVQVLCKKLRNTFPIDRINEYNEKVKEENLNKRQKRAKKSGKDTAAKLKDAPKVNLDNYSTMPLDEELEMFESDDDLNDNDDAPFEQFSDDDGEDDGEARSSKQIEQPLYVLPLYSLLSSEKQIKVFEKPPDGCRLCIVATNVAETSLTIPNIKYVIDTGKIKMKFYDKITGVSTFDVCWTSKASADQRAGRAGRTSPGHCYRIYSTAVYNDDFKLFTEPEIVRKPVEDLILQMKDLGIDRVHNFPFPTPPNEASIRAAENLLIKLGALEVDKTKTKSLKEIQITKITALGKTMSCFPVNPRYGKMLTLANQHNLLEYVICMISTLSVQELFVDGETVLSQTTVDNKETSVKIKFSQLRQAWAGQGQTLSLGDIMVLLVAIGAVEYEGGNEVKFCEQNGIRFKGISEARKLRKQLTNTVNSVFPKINLILDPKLQPPSEQQAKLLRQIVLSGMVDKIAKRYDHVVAMKDGRETKNAYQGLLLEEPLFIHPNSVLFKELPTYVCYIDLVETSKMFMKGVCAIDEEWLPVYLSNQCTFAKPEEEPQPRFDSHKDTIVCCRKSTFGRVMWSIKAVEVEYPLCLDKYKWFARYLLDGLIFEFFKKYSNVLLASPSTMLKSWAKLQPRTECLLNALVARECHTKAKLKEVWSGNKEYLCKEYLMWIPEALHTEIRLKWPPNE